MLALAGGTARAERTVATNRMDVSFEEAPAISARLAGHTFAIADGVLTISDIAGEGAPRIGVVVRVGSGLMLDAADGRWRLTGALARPRIAGPGYTVWVIGTPGADGALQLRRLGVLRKPVAK